MSLDVSLEVEEEQFVPCDVCTDKKVWVRRAGEGLKQIPLWQWEMENPDREPCLTGEEGDGFSTLCTACNGTRQRSQGKEVFTANVTGNLWKMADAVGVGKACWSPNENGITHAKQLIPILEKGLKLLEENPDRYKQFENRKGWGTVQWLTEFVGDYLEACRQYPEAKVSVW